VTDDPAVPPHCFASGPGPGSTSACGAGHAPATPPRHLRRTSGRHAQTPWRDCDWPSDGDI
jgi:hypothetical protein